MNVYDRVSFRVYQCLTFILAHAQNQLQKLGKVAVNYSRTKRYALSAGAIETRVSANDERRKPRLFETELIDVGRSFAFDQKGESLPVRRVSTH